MFSSILDRVRVAVDGVFRKLGGEEPWSTWSAVSYLVLGIWLATTAPSVRSVLVNDALLILFAGTAVFHYRHSGGHDLFDAIGMASALGGIALYAYGVGWLLVLFGVVGIPILFVLVSKSGLKLHWLMGFLVGGAFLALWSTGRYGFLLASFVSFLAAYVVHSFPASAGTAKDSTGAYVASGDRWHAAWHVGAALGMLFLLLAGR